MSDLDQWATLARHQQARLDAARLQLAAADKAAGAALHLLTAAEEAQAILQTVAATVQQATHKQVAATVTECLACVFGEGAYALVINFVEARGKTEAVVTLQRDGVSYDPMQDTGGGVVDVAAFALRVAALVMRRPAGRLCLVMDEPFKFVSEDYRAGICNMLDHLHNHLGVQFLYVTHIPELCLGEVLRL